MRMIKATRKSKLTLISVCLIFLLAILYCLELGSIWSYILGRVSYNGSYKSCFEVLRKSRFIKSPSFNVHPDGNHHFERKYRESKQAFNIKETNHLARLPGIPSMSETVKRGRFDFGRRSPSNCVFDNVSHTGDILCNVSFHSVMQVTDGFGLNATLFLKWAETHMLERRKTSFEKPKWMRTGEKICDNGTEMIIIIPSVPGHAFTRELVRQTWASPLYGANIRHLWPISLRTRLAFLIGESSLPDSTKADLRREESLYNDIVSAEFFDSYRNLSLKVMLGLNWVSTYCASAKYVMKADLDTFVNLPLLSRFILEISKRVPRYIVGHRHVWPNPPVLRSGKWSIDKELYPFDSFPPYLYGHSYVMTSDITAMIVSLGKYLPIIPAEDAHTTGVLARLIRAPRLHYDGFANIFRKVISCRIMYNYEMSVTKMSQQRLIAVWSDLLNKNCSEVDTPPRIREDTHHWKP